MESNEEIGFGKKWDLSLSDLHSIVKNGKATELQINEYNLRKQKLTEKSRENNGGSTK